ncbi:Twinfilin-1 [Schistosoma japonicum]|nr:Twinfilin-1 [Schistosoma japonicum]
MPLSCALKTNGSILIFLRNKFQVNINTVVKEWTVCQIYRAAVQMTHQSGIHADSSVTSKLADCKRCSCRAIKLIIENEKIILGTIIPSNGSWEDDFDSAMRQLLYPASPCYVFYRLDSLNSFGNDWIFINWVPETANVRQKMIYASTKATVRKQFGDNLIKDDVTANSVSDINLRAYKNRVASQNAPRPYTAAEIEMAGIRTGEVSAGLHSSHQTIGGVSFALSPDSHSVLKSFSSEKCDYVQLVIDISSETIKVCKIHEHITPRAIANACPEKEGRYHLFRFRYMFEGQEHSATFFIHTISGYQSSVKSRMLYSSCKAALLTQLEHDYGITFDHRFETDGTDELTSEYLMDILYPKQQEKQLVFQKPQGPMGRRPRTHIH